MRCLVVVLVVLVGALLPSTAYAHMLCTWFVVCPYASPGFSLIVVDAASGKPLPNVYAWAEWIQYSNHGLNGPLMVQEAVSTPDGRLVFSWWGPRFGYRAGLDIGSDPAVLLFKPGYATLIIQNGERPGMSVTDVIRIVTFRNDTVRLPSFVGTLDERVRQLRALAFSPSMGRMSRDQATRFRTPYLKRLDLAVTELDRLPRDAESVARLRSALEYDRTFFTGER